jgi:hypothetical protein
MNSRLPEARRIGFGWKARRDEPGRKGTLQQRRAFLDAGRGLIYLPNDSKLIRDPGCLMMKRRAFVTLVGGVYVFLCISAGAQEGYYGVCHEKWHQGFYSKPKCLLDSCRLELLEG